MNKDQLTVLRAKSHSIDPIVRVGKSGITKALIEQVDKAFKHRELVKIKFLKASVLMNDRHKLAEQLATGTRAHIVSVVGNTTVLYRRNGKHFRNKR